MNIDMVKESIANTLMASVLGYTVSLGVTFDSAVEAFQNPHATNWEAVGSAFVETAFTMNEKVTPYIEGPVNDLVKGAKSAFLENAKTIDLKSISPEYY